MPAAIIQSSLRLPSLTAAPQPTGCGTFTPGPTPGAGENPVGHALLLFQGGQTTESGSGTFEDPATITSHRDLTIKAGTALVAPSIVWIGEVYGDGSEDPVLPDDWWGTYVTGEIVFDGRTVVTDLSQTYVSPQFFDPLIAYQQPTSYGSIGVGFVQGAIILIHPLPVGVHHLTEVSRVSVPSTSPLLPDTGLVYNSGMKFADIRLAFT